MELNALLAELCRELLSFGIPLSHKIEPQVKVNSRAKRRLGCCIYKNGRYVIEISAVLAKPETPEQHRRLRETMVHELLHTCKGCGNHGALWKHYAQQMNHAYGYAIERTVKGDAQAEVQPPAYVLRCCVCAREIGRTRLSKVIQFPERYRCPCGGTLKRIK